MTKPLIGMRVTMFRRGEIREQAHQAARPPATSRPAAKRSDPPRLRSVPGGLRPTTARRTAAIVDLADRAPAVPLGQQVALPGPALDTMRHASVTRSDTIRSLAANPSSRTG